MTARNLKIRITVGHDEGRQPRRASAQPSAAGQQTTAPQLARTAPSTSTNKLPKWLTPALIVGALLGGLWFFLSGSEPSGPERGARTETNSAPTAERATSALDLEPSRPTVSDSGNQRTPDTTPTNITDGAPPAGAVGAPNPAADTGGITTPPKPTRADALTANAASPEVSAAEAKSQASSNEETTRAPAATPAAASPPPVDNSLALATSDKVSRATFATAVTRLEPVEPLEGALSSERGLARIHFFTELQGLNGQRIVHRWLVNGQRIADIPVNVSSNRFRASSNMRLSSNRVGTWEVQVVDARGTVLHASHLEYR